MEIQTLDAQTLLADRPFTHPDRTFDDLRTLNRSLARLRAALHTGILRGDDPMVSWSWDDEAGNTQRIYARTGINLRELPKLYLVGFFGQRRPDADRVRMDGVDDALIEDMSKNHGQIVVYYTALLENGQYGNMVLSTSDDARGEWNNAVRHAQAVRELAPFYYRSVRLHNGHLSGGLLSADGVMLTVTKYFDYGQQGSSETPPWRAVRVWAPPARLAA